MVLRVTSGSIDGSCAGHLLSEDENFLTRVVLTLYKAFLDYSDST
jgi:hypothetical protein